MEEELLPSRRELIELALRAAALPGAAVFFSSWLRGAAGHQHDGSEAPPEPVLMRDYQPKFFSEEEFRALEAFTEMLIPTDDTPGAKEARCASFIDFVLEASDEMPQTQKSWRKAMAALKDTGFYEADAGRRLELMKEMSRPELEHGVEHPAFLAYRLIKQQAAFAFYTSREGMIETLDYRGNSYNISFPACMHPEHQVV